MADTGSILVTGAAGQLGAVGRTVTGLLLERGLPVRAVGRTQARKPFVGPAGRPLWPAAPTSAWRAVSQQGPNFRIVSQPRIEGSVFSVLCEPVPAAEMSLARLP